MNNQFNERSRLMFGATLMLVLSVCGVCNLAVASETNSSTPAGWVTKPISLPDALNLALQQNRTILKSKRDLEAAHGISLQTRAIAIPKIQATGKYTDTDPEAIETFPGGLAQTPHQTWNTGIQIIQSIYEGGKIVSAFRAAKLTKEQAWLQHQSVIADMLLAVRTNYYGVLLSAQQILVREASVNLLTKELEDQKRRYDAGTVPRFNVLRAEVAVANARPALIRARNSNRIAKNNFTDVLGCELPRDAWENIPLELTDSLQVAPLKIELPQAIAEALERRTELGALRKGEQLKREDIVSARAGNLPSIQAFAGYGWRNSSFSTDLGQTVEGWQVGGQLSWNIFDGMLSRGKVIQARAAHEKSKIELKDASSHIELEVRITYSGLMQAAELLESQKKVQEQAEESLRLAKARADAGTATQLDVLNAETALTEARTTQIEAEHEYAVAVARMEHAIGNSGVQTQSR